MFVFAFPQALFAFTDLPETHKYYFTLTYLESEGAIAGYPDGTVKPDNLVNRAELVMILFSGLKIAGASAAAPCFPDVPLNKWFTDPVCIAKQRGWIAGYPDGKFRPEQPVNRIEAMAIILNVYGIPSADPHGISFTDISGDAWYLKFLQAAVDKNLLEEAGGKLNPGEERTRGEIAEMVRRILNLRFTGDSKYTPEIGTEFQTFFLLNKLRKENGNLAPLKFNPLLIKTAREHSKDMAEVIGDMSHDGSDGSLASDRIRASGVEGNLGTGENVGKGWISATRSVYKAILDVHNNIFMPEDPDECNHRTTILSKCLPFSEVGIGIWSKDNMTYFTEDFVSIH